jgi:hypothetical protein
MCREIHVSDINVALLDSCDEGYGIPRTHFDDLVNDSENPFLRAFDYSRLAPVIDGDEGSAE